MKRKRKKMPPISPDERARWDENQRKLAERIAYHQAKLAEERAKQS
jgi:hypothetical protein